MPAVLFGSIGTIAETSELQRAAFNEAFREHGLDWTWSADEYRELLRDSGGRARIEAYARERGQEVDAAAIHRTKSEIFQRKLVDGALRPRPGIVDTVMNAREKGYKVALVTTTEPGNVRALKAAVEPALDLDAFDLVVDTTDVEAPKPDGAAYRYALERLSVSPEESVAVEDNVGGVVAAREAGLKVIAFPGANTAGHDFSGARGPVESLSMGEVELALGA